MIKSLQENTKCNVSFSTLWTNIQYNCNLRAELSATGRAVHGQSCPVTDSNMAICVHCKKEISNRIITDNSFIMFILQGKGHFCTSRLK